MKKLIIGLGNPGKKHEMTRHNIGFVAADELKNNMEFDFSNWKKNTKTQSLVAKSDSLILAKPQTFMNNSGQAVQKLMFYYDISLNDILIIHDDIDLLFGETKLQKDRSSAGHRGIQSIIDQLNSKDFWRLRIGVAKKENKRTGNAAKFVLNKFSLFERKKLKKIIEQAIDKIKNQFL